MNSAPLDPLIGRTLDERYVVRSRIARGGMAMVYLANDLRLQRRVAVKVMHQHLVEDENFTRRFEQEARSAAMLGHANVVGVFDQGVDAGLPYLVMEYLPGITLRELLKQQTRLTADQALEIGEAVLGGLAAAHSAGIVHRDLKPENVLLADDGRIKIGDFGLARAVSANTTTGQALLGTIAYLSPELVTRGLADARSDVYAFGIMMFEMLTGRQPFQGEQAMQIAYQHAHSEVPLASTVNPEVSPELDELVRWCTQRDPELRPNDAGEAIGFLREIRGGATLGATRVLPVTGVVGAVTPSTTVLSSAEQVALAEGAGREAGAGERDHRPPAGPTERAGAAARGRARRGRWMAAVLIVLIALAGGAGWWWGQGPGSLVTVPQVSGDDPVAAQQRLEDLSLVVTVAECPSLDVEAGLAVGTKPSAGARVEQGTAIELCVSTGPELLPVPAIVGLGVDEAKSAIETARFAFGEVLEERFDGGERGTVILALDENGEGLGETYREQGRIDLIVSAGSLPAVAGNTVEEATKTLADLGLTVDSAMNGEDYHDDIPVGQVIGLIVPEGTVRVGDSIGLQLSLGPELFEIPDVSGKRMREAVQILKDAGFSPVTGVPEMLWNAVRVEGTSPAAGEKQPKGASVQLNFEL
ncbi:MAG: Stk1 family PASTA domain-containing Ser/Thr kinase [Leucobacter sp.]